MIIAVNVPQDKTTDDLSRAQLLCSTVNSNVIIESIHSDRPLPYISNRIDQLPKTPTYSAHFGPVTQGQSDAAKVQIAGLHRLIGCSLSICVHRYPLKDV